MNASYFVIPRISWMDTTGAVNQRTCLRFDQIWIEDIRFVS